VSALPKTLYLLRHGEAAPDSAEGDRRRPLTPAGQAAAHRLGRFMRAEAIRVDYGLASDALRARATLHAVTAEWTAPPLSVIDPAIYNTDAEGLLTRIQDVGDAAALLVVGHNPAMSALVQALAAESDGSLTQRLPGGLPPLGLAIFSVRCRSWHGLQPAQARLVRVVLSDDF
jgi:phosphohistidine phosphatase